METANYQCSIAANIPPSAAFASIANVAAWWSKNFKGQATQNGDTFTVHFGDTFVAFTIEEAMPDKKIIWKVTDCYLPFLHHKTEWNGTSVVWEISAFDGITTIEMTHIGLTPTVECFGVCQKGWNEHIKGSLYHLITTGVGQPK